MSPHRQLLAALLLATALLSIEVVGSSVRGVATSLTSPHGVRTPAVRRRARSLDEDLGPVLSMFAPGPRSRCGCKQLTLCDLATTLLQAVEANKAQDAEALKKRKTQSLPPPPLWGVLGRFRRAEVHRTPLPRDTQDADNPPNPTLLHITQSFLHRLREEEHAEWLEAQRRDALLKAQAAVDRQLAASKLADDEEDYEEDASAVGEDHDDGKGSTSPAIQKIASTVH